MNFKIPKQTIVLLIVSIFLVFVVILIVILLFFSQKNSIETPGTSVTPTTLPNGFVKREHFGNSPIKPTAVSPEEDLSGQTITNPSQKITYLLSESIDPKVLRVTVNPSLPITIKQEGSKNSLLIYPDPPDYWHPNVLYVIKIFDQANNLIDTYQIKVPRLKLQEIPAENEAWLESKN